MIKFNKPVNLNGTELIAEIKAVGITINDIPILEDGELWLDIEAKDEVKVAEIVANHNGTIIAPEPTIEDKLASVGLSLAELKAALS